RHRHRLPERLFVGDQVVGGEHHHHRVGIEGESGGRHRRGGVAAHGLHDDLRWGRARILQLGHDLSDVRPVAHHEGRRRFPSSHPADGRLDESLVSHEGVELLGSGGRRQWPQPRAAAAGQDDGGCRCHRLHIERRYRSRNSRYVLTPERWRSISSSVSSRSGRAGTPTASVHGGISFPSGRTDPAASQEPSPITAPLRTRAPIPTRQPSPMTAPWTTAEWPTVVRSPMIAGKPASQWTTTLSWMLVSEPTTTRSSSARSTAPNRTTAPSPIVTTPRTVALEATKADGWICGWGRSGLTLFCDTYGNVAAVETHPAHDPDGGRALDEAVLVGRLGPLAEQGPDGCSQPRLGAVRSLGLRLL